MGAGRQSVHRRSGGNRQEVQTLDGVVTGIVKNNWSEDFPGKLMVEYTLGEAGKMETGWLPFMTGYAGPGYGGYQMPEIGTEVVIGFHSGDSRRPIVLGCLWNQTNTPPEQTSNEKNSKKLWRSREGYQVLLNEDEDALELSFSDPAGEHTMTLSSKEDGLLTWNLKTKTVLQFAGEDFLTIEKGMITIAGPVTVKAESIGFETEKNLTAAVEGEAKLSVTGAVTVESEDAVTLQAGKNLGVSADGAATFKAAKGLEVTGKNVSLNPDDKTEIKGRNVEVKPGQGYALKTSQVKLEGMSLEIKASASGKVESGGILQVKGQMLKLN